MSAAGGRRADGRARAVVENLFLAVDGGCFAGNAVLTYCRKIGVADAELLARIAQCTIVVFVVLIAVDELDRGGVLVQQTFLILLAGLVFAPALAFGPGGRDAAAALLQRWFPPQETRLGGPPATGRERQ